MSTPPSSVPCEYSMRRIGPASMMKPAPAGRVMITVMRSVVPSVLETLAWLPAARALAMVGSTLTASAVMSVCGRLKKLMA